MPTADAPTPLDRLAALAREADAPGIARDALTRARRIAEGRFYVACIGQFKRGKSTLLNALVGVPVLPTGVVPVTSVVTILRYGPELAARARPHDAEWIRIDPCLLSDYVSETGNPENAKGIEVVEVFVPSSLLARGMCLVDTPGIGSTLEGNTAVTRAFAPQIDAALVVLGGDPPVSNEELALIEDVAARVDTLIVVLNKADRLSDAERREAKVFTERVLNQGLGRAITPILEVSATEQLTGHGPPRDWSGLVARLESLARDAGSEIVESAERRGLKLLAGRLLQELDERHGALTRPLRESEQRIAVLKQCAAEAERSTDDLGALFAAEQQRLARTFAAHRERFLAQAVPAARAELAAGLASAEERRRSALRRHAFALTQDIYRRWVDRWRAEEQPAAEQIYREATQHFVEMANRFLERLVKSGEAAFLTLPHALGPEVGFRTKSRLFYTEMLPLTARSPLDWLLDLLRPPGAAFRALERSTGDYLEHLLTSNAARIMNDLNDRVLEGRRGLESEVRACLREVYASAERALDDARAQRASGESAVRIALERIERLRRDVISTANEEG